MNTTAEQEVMKSANAELAYAWNFLADLGSSKQFSLTGAFPKGMSANDMNAEVDKIRAVFDRQQAKSAVLTVEQEVEGMKNNLANLKADIARIDAKYDIKGGASSAERNNRESAITTMTGLMKKLEQHEALLAKLKEEAK